MSDYLVRWKFGPNSLINHLDVETTWFQSFHTSKTKAVDHYTSLLHNSSPSMAMTAEVFQLVKLIPGQPEPADTNGEAEETFNELGERNALIMKMYNKGYTRRAIADKSGLSYQTVYAITRKMSQEA